jgi:hypothetical protein
MGEAPNRETICTRIQLYGTTVINAGFLVGVVRGAAFSCSDHMRSHPGRGSGEGAACKRAWDEGFLRTRAVNENGSGSRSPGVTSLSARVGSRARWGEHRRKRPALKGSHGGRRNREDQGEN